MLLTIYVKCQTPEMAVRKEEIDKIDILANTIYYLETPVKENEIVGNMKILLNNESIEVLNIYVQEEIQRKEIIEYLKEFVKLQFF